MKTSSLELLERTQLLPAQARAILQVMELELAARDHALATKADLRDGLLASRADFRDGLLASRADFRDGLLASRADFRAGLHDLELKLEGLRTEMQTQRAELIGEIKGTVRWNFAFWVTQLAAMAAILKLLK